MSITIQKLRQLWKNRNLKEREVKRRAEQIYGILGRWEQDQSAVLAIKDYGNPEDKDIPTDSWSGVKNRLRVFYENQPELKERVAQVEDVSNLLHLQQREERFRVSSDADRNSPYESSAIRPNRRNPEAHFASYNFPFEIIKFFFSCKQAGPFFKLHLPFEHRFIPKFIWMLANPEKVVPILSLHSFRELSPLFRELAQDVEWGEDGGRWELSLSDFVAAWPGISNQLCLRITDQGYPALPEEEKRALAILLFIASVSQTTTKNAFDMIRTGNKAMVLYGPPGTGKTYYAQEVVRELLAQPEDADHAEAPESAKPTPPLEECKFSNIFRDASPVKQISLPHGCWEIVQFHPSYSYHDFIGGIVPNVEGKDLSYMKSEGIFKRFCDAARVSPNYPFVFVIDEINRADLSSVFGELMYALEYRGRSVSTVHFGQFLIPKNVYVIGTMNTTDKSLVTFDLALRRRFLFMKLGPDLDTLYNWNTGQESFAAFPEDELSAFVAKAEALNGALVSSDGLALPEDYAIGQAYFMKIRDFCPSEETGKRHISEFARERLWDYHLEPLIEEYLGAETKTWKAKIQELKDQFTKEERSAN